MFCEMVSLARMTDGKRQSSILQRGNHDFLPHRPPQGAKQRFNLPKDSSPLSLGSALYDGRPCIPEGQAVVEYYLCHERCGPDGPMPEEAFPEYPVEAFAGKNKEVSRGIECWPILFKELVSQAFVVRGKDDEPPPGLRIRKHSLITECGSCRCSKT